MLESLYQYLCAVSWDVIFLWELIVYLNLLVYDSSDNALFWFINEAVGTADTFSMGKHYDVEMAGQGSTHRKGVHAGAWH